MTFQLKYPSIVLILFVLAQTNISAQSYLPREKYFTWGYNFGFFGFSPSLRSNSSGEGHNFRRTTGLFKDNGRGDGRVFSGTTSLGLNSSFLWGDKHSKNFTAIRLEFQQNRASYVFNHPFAKIPNPGGDHDADDPDSVRATWVENDVYFKYSLSIQRFWHRIETSQSQGESYYYWKESFGQTFFHRNQGIPIKLGGEETRTDAAGNITIAKTTGFNPNAYMLGTEFGTRYTPDPNRSLDIGIAWYMPLTGTYSRAYEFFKTIPSTIANKPPVVQSVGTTNVSLGGSSVMLNITYSYNYQLKSREVDTTRYHKKIHEPKAAPIAHVHKPHTLNGRSVKIQEKIKVGDSTIVAAVWDKGVIDGDIISLYLNGEEILHDFTVGKTKNDLVLHLKPGSNYLVMHALNLGRIPPNTAAIEIIDDTKHSKVTLNSDTKKSGAIEIYYKPGNAYY